MSCVEAFATGIKIESSDQSTFWEPIKGLRGPPNCEDQGSTKIWPLTHKKSSDQGPQKGRPSDQAHFLLIKNLDPGHKRFNRRHISDYLLCKFLHSKLESSQTEPQVNLCGHFQLDFRTPKWPWKRSKSILLSPGGSFTAYFRTPTSATPLSSCQVHSHTRTWAYLTTIATLLEHQYYRTAWSVLSTGTPTCENMQPWLESSKSHPSDRKWARFAWRWTSR